jgi:hypothetical protein
MASEVRGRFLGIGLGWAIIKAIAGMFASERPKTPLIERVYEAVSERLADVMADLITYGNAEVAAARKVAASLEIELPDASPFTPDENRVIDRAAWRPVAQVFVHALLPALLEEAAATGRTAFDLGAAYLVWVRRVSLHDLAESTSLAMSDTQIACSAVGQVFFETDLFDGRETMWVGDREFRIARSGRNELAIALVSAGVPIAPVTGREEPRVATAFAG